MFTLSKLDLSAYGSMQHEYLSQQVAQRERSRPADADEVLLKSNEEEISLSIEAE